VSNAHSVLEKSKSHPQKGDASPHQRNIDVPTPIDVLGESDVGALAVHRRGEQEITEHIVLAYHKNPFYLYKIDLVWLQKLFLKYCSILFHNANFFP